MDGRPGALARAEDRVCLQELQDHKVVNDELKSGLAGREGPQKECRL